MDARLIVDVPGPGHWNMAVDEILLQGLVSGGPGVIRLYRWLEPCLTLGYFQSHGDRTSHPASLPLPFTRRSTGGGAIVHDHELTYSIALPLADDRPQVARRLLATVHQSLVQLFGELNLQVSPVQSVKEKRAEREPFLCFQRRTADDLLLGDHKVVGSAQRRRRHGLLQHGSILLRRSRAAPELPGIEDLSGIESIEVELIERWPTKVAVAIGLTLFREALTPAELSLAGAIASSRFASEEWKFRR